MSKLQELSSKREKLANRRAQLTADLEAGELQAENLRGIMAEAMLNDQDTAQEERELMRLESRARVTRAAIERAGVELGSLDSEIDRLQREQAIREYQALEKRGWEQLRALAKPLQALGEARAALQATAERMGQIEQDNPRVDWNSPETKTARIPELGDTFRQEMYDMTWELHELIPDDVAFTPAKIPTYQLSSPSNLKHF
jgi:chromosome segregation ATPase